MLQNLDIRKVTSIGILFAFLINTLGPMPARADGSTSLTTGEFLLPKPGVMVHLSPEFNPLILKGIKVHTDNPFRFDFILDTGDDHRSFGLRPQDDDALRRQSTKLIKYFLASLTIPEKDLWVNLSPYEKDRIIPQSFGLTEMGRDLLAQDYILKQITASLIYPEDELGKKFWKRIYEQAQKKYGTTQIPVNTFNKVWIVPEKAVVYENAKAGTAYVVESKLKVMLEEDYLSMSKNTVGAGPSAGPNGRAQGPARTDVNQLGSQIVRELVIPELTKEVNENKNFSQLRQVYNSLILATWYKKKIKDSILAQVYADRNKVAGVGFTNDQRLTTKDKILDADAIYQRYLQAFKKGVYNYIKEDIDPVTQKTIPRKYFSGGATFTSLAMTAMQITSRQEVLPGNVGSRAMIVEANISSQIISQNQAMIQRSPGDRAMTSAIRSVNWIEEMDKIFAGGTDARTLLVEKFDTYFFRLIRQERDINRIQQAGKHFRTKWRQMGLPGIPNQYLSRMIRHYILPGDFPTTVRREAALSTIDSSESFLEEIAAVWQTAHVAIHLKYWGPHIDIMEGRYGFFDNDYIVQRAHRLLELLIQRRDDPLLNSHPPKALGFEGEVKFTYKDIMLWAVTVMLNPLVHNYMYNPTPGQGVIGRDMIRMVGLKYWPGGPMEAMEYYTNRVINGLDKDKADELLSQAFSKDYWQGLGLRSPFDVFAFLSDGPDIWRYVLAPPTKPFLEDMTFIIAAPFEHHASDPDTKTPRRYYFRDTRNFSYAKGLSAYIFLTKLPSFKEGLPKTMAALEQLPGIENARAEAIQIAADSQNMLQQFQQTRIYKMETEFDQRKAVDIEHIKTIRAAFGHRDYDWPIIQRYFSMAYDPKSEKINFPKLHFLLHEAFCEEDADKIIRQWLVQYEANWLGDEFSWTIIHRHGQVLPPLEEVTYSESSAMNSSTEKHTQGAIDSTPASSAQTTPENAVVKESGPGDRAMNRMSLEFLKLVTSAVVIGCAGGCSTISMQSSRIQAEIGMKEYVRMDHLDRHDITPEDREVLKQVAVKVDEAINRKLSAAEFYWQVDKIIRWNYNIQKGFANADSSYRKIGVTPFKDDIVFKLFVSEIVRYAYGYAFNTFGIKEAGQREKLMDYLKGATYLGYWNWSKHSEGEYTWGPLILDRKEGVIKINLGLTKDVSDIFDTATHEFMHLLSDNTNNLFKDFGVHPQDDVTWLLSSALGEYSSYMIEGLVLFNDELKERESSPYDNHVRIRAIPPSGALKMKWQDVVEYIKKFKKGGIVDGKQVEFYVEGHNLARYAVSHYGDAGGFLIRLYGTRHDLNFAHMELAAGILRNIMWEFKIKVWQFDVEQLILEEVLKENVPADIRYFDLASLRLTLTDRLTEQLIAQGKIEKKSADRAMNVDQLTGADLLNVPPPAHPRQSNGETKIPVDRQMYKDFSWWPHYTDNPFFQTNDKPKSLDELNAMYEHLLKDTFDQHTPRLVTQEDDQLIRSLGGGEGPAVGFVRLLNEKTDKRIDLADEMAGYLTRPRAVIRRIKAKAEELLDAQEYTVYLLVQNKLGAAYQFEYWVYQVLTNFSSVTNIAKDLESKKGGIDLTPANVNLQTKNTGEAIQFHMDPAMLQQLQNAPGFTPVIINIAPLDDLRLFLGINESTPSLRSG